VLPGSAPDNTSDSERSGPGLAARCFVGGLLMGFANLVPGISGGAMLLIVGVYTRFIAAVADITTLRFRARSIVTLASVAFGAGVSILLLAGTVKWLILHHRWETFSLFIGLRLGAVPMVWRLCRPANGSVWIGFGAGVAVTAILAAMQYSSGGGATAGGGAPMLFFAGLAGASATILPGLDGSYLLMLLGQYVPILGAISRFKDGLVAGDWSASAEELWVLVPVGVGVVCGIGGVSVLLRWLFRQFPKATAGVLLGIVVGAFIGLWPFADSVPPQAGQVVRGQVLTAQAAAAIRPEDWPLRFVTPTLAQAAGSLGLIVVGAAAAWALSKLEPKDASRQ
jgi:putative membrane protein